MRTITPSKHDGGTWKRERRYCPLCRKRVAVQKNGNLYDHGSGYIGEQCDGGGMRGLTYAEVREIARIEAVALEVALDGQE